MQSHHSAITPSPTPAPSAGCRLAWASRGRAPPLPARPSTSGGDPTPPRRAPLPLHRPLRWASAHLSRPAKHPAPAGPSSFSCPRVNHQTTPRPKNLCYPPPPRLPSRPRGPEHLGPRAGMNRPTSPPSPPHPLLTRSPERCRPARDNPSIHQRKAPARSPVPYRSGSSHPLPPTPCTLSSSPHRPPLAVLPFG